MTTLTEDQLWDIADVVFAGHGIDGDKLVQSTEPLQNFVTQWGQPDRNFNGVNEWNNLQTRKGARRGDLVVYEIDGGTVSHFGGEA